MECTCDNNIGVHDLNIHMTTLLEFGLWTLPLEKLSQPPPPCIFTIGTLFTNCKSGAETSKILQQRI